jgi:hypothetical protein
MMRTRVLPAPDRTGPERPEAREPDAAVRAELERLEQRERVRSAKLEELFAKNRTFVSETAARARKIQPGAASPAERLAKIDAAEKEALEKWKELEAGARRTLELRARRLEARRKALAHYLEARKRGSGGPTPPRRPQRS